MYHRVPANWLNSQFLCYQRSLKIEPLYELFIQFSNRTLMIIFQIHKSVNELHERINPKILPKEYGGEVPLADMIQQFKNKLKECREEILDLDDMHIEIDEKNCKLLAEMNEELGVGLEGSFKKLQVD